MRVFPNLLILAVLTPVLSMAQTFNPDFYPFQNGVKFPTTEEGVRYVKSLGYKGVGSIYPRDLAAFNKACDAEDLNVISIYAGGKVHADGFTYGPEVSEAIKLLKGTNALVELNVQRGKDPNDEQAAAFVREIATQAKAAGLKVVLYPHANFHIERVEHAVQIAKASGCDNVGVTFNLCHFLKVQPDSDLRATLENVAPLLWSASTCGADLDGTSWKELIQPLDHGTFDQSTFLRHLQEIGFTGPVGLQCYNVTVPPKEHLKRSMEAWKKVLAANK